MRFSIAVLAMLTFASTASATTFVYVSQPKENAIGVFKMNDADGVLERTATIDVGASPGSLAVDPQRKFLFASLRTATKIASYAIDPATGGLTPISDTPLAKGANAAYVGTDRSGKFLLSASYSGGRVVVHGVDAAGKLTPEPLQVVETAKTAHSCYTDTANARVFVPHVAPNAIFEFRFDAATGKLTEFGGAPGGTPNAGPRHLAIHASQTLACSSDETGSSVTLYTLDDQGLTPKQTLSTLPADFAAKNSTADVKLHPNGKFVWVSNRGHDSLAGFAVDEQSPSLTAIGQTPTEKTPRSFDIERSGRFLYSGGEGTGKIAAYRIDATTGKLERFATYDAGASVSWVLAVTF